MTWHYQIRKKKTDCETYYDIVEVFRIEGKRCWTEDSIAPISDTPKGMVEVLKMMLKDIQHYPVLREPKEKKK